MKMKVMKWMFPFALLAGILVFDTLVVNINEPFAIPIGLFALLNLMLYFAVWFWIAGKAK